MKAILIDSYLSSTGSKKNHPYNLSILTKIVNKSIIEHQLERLKKIGILDITIITSKEVYRKCLTGNHCNINLSHANNLSCIEYGGSESSTDIVIMPAGILTNLNVNQLVIKHKYSESKLTCATISKSHSKHENTLFNPFIIKINELNELLQKNQFLDLNALTNNTHLNNEYSMLKKSIIIYNPVSLNDFWQLHMNIVSEENPKIEYNGFPLNDKIWIDVDSQIHPSSKINGTVIIGRNTKIGKGVELNGNVVIGDNVVIDNHARITNSVILKNTYIGPEIEVKSAVVNKNLLYDRIRDSHMTISDNFILGETNKINRYFNKFRVALTG